MKPLLLTLPMLLVLLPSSALADSVSIFLSPNDGSGDNFGFLAQTGAAMVSISGGTPFSFFSTQGFAPGSTFGGATSVFFSDGTIQLGNNVYDLGFNGPGSLFVSSFAFPTNGQSFSIQASATFSASGYFFVDGQQRQVTLGGSAPGIVTLTFDPTSGLYFANPIKFSSTTVPEPGTLGLMGTGLTGLLVFARSKLQGRNFTRGDA